MPILSLSNPILLKVATATTSYLIDIATLIKIGYKCERQIFPTIVSSKDFDFLIKLGFDHLYNKKKYKKKTSLLDFIKKIHVQ